MKVAVGPVARNPASATRNRSRQGIEAIIELYDGQWDEWQRKLKK